MANSALVAETHHSKASRGLARWAGCSLATQQLSATNGGGMALFSRHPAVRSLGTVKKLPRMSVWGPPAAVPRERALVVQRLCGRPLLTL